jgi:hypothetical protein
MATKPYQIRNFLIPPSVQTTDFLLSETDADKGQLVICNGVNPSWKIGSLLKDLGYSKIGGDIITGKTITGLHNFIQVPGTQYLLSTLNNAGNTATGLYYNNAGIWTLITNSDTTWTTPNTLVEMEDYIGYCFMVGYVPSTSTFISSASLTGTTFSTSTQVTNMPKAKYIKKYQSQIYIANCNNGGTNYPFRVYFSTVPIAGSITWLPAANFFDVDYSEQITALGSNWNKLLIFTQYGCYFYDNTPSLQKQWDTGCVNHRTLKNFEGYTFWASKENIWVSTGGRPNSIGDDILQLILNSDATKWTAEVVDREYNIYLGSTSANGIGYSNCVATYNILTKMWRWREYYDQIGVLSKYTLNSITSGSDNFRDFLIFGNYNGQIMKKSKYTDITPIYSDNGQPIFSHFRTKALDMGRRDVLKAITKATVYSNYAQNVMMRYRIINTNQELLMPFTDMKNLKKVINKVLDAKIEGNFIQFEGKEASINQTWEFNGIDLLYEFTGDLS